MPIEELPIYCYYNKQRFLQFGAMDCANWYGVAVDDTKKNQAMYPAMGRKHIVFQGLNQLIFTEEPRQVFKTIRFMYVIVGTQVIQYDRFFQAKPIGNISLGGEVWFDFLPVGNVVYALLTDETHVYVITEDGSSVTMGVVTDANTPVNPIYVAAFGNRFVVSSRDTPDFQLTQINLGGVPPVDLSKVFTIPDGLGGGFALFARASGIIRQMCVLHTQLYIFNDFTTDIWANVATQITVAGVTREFPWKLNTSYNWDYGMNDAFSMAVDFGRVCWLAQNTDGLVAFMVSNGQQPEDFSTQAINVLLENSTDGDDLSPFLAENSQAFLYQYENTIFYRVSAGPYTGTDLLDDTRVANALEYNFETKTWARVIELNGERNRIQKHVYFANRHIVTVENDPAMYQMAGNIYYNETINTAQPDHQAANAFLKYPMRYELVTKQLFTPEYAEFIDDYVEIDFVFGDQTFYRTNAPFLNAQFIVTEDSTPTDPIYVVTEDSRPESPIFVIAEDGNTPAFDDNHYFALFKPYIELFYSDDGGVTFSSADVREFSPLGQYRWRMRWYELDISRNRCYRLVCVSSAPIVILGAVRNTRRASGGAN